MKAPSWDSLALVKVPTTTPIKLEPDESSWERLLSVKKLPRGPQVTSPDDRVSLPRTPLSRPVTGADQKKCGGPEVRSNSRMSRLSSIEQRIIDRCLTAADAGSEWRVQCVTEQLEPRVSKNPRDGQVGVIMVQSSSSSSS